MPMTQETYETKMGVAVRSTKLIVIICMLFLEAEIIITCISLMRRRVAKDRESE